MTIDRKLENGTLTLTAEGKTVFLMGSFGVDEQAEYPRRPSLFVFPFLRKILFPHRRRDGRSV